MARSKLTGGARILGWPERSLSAGPLSVLGAQRGNQRQAPRILFQFGGLRRERRSLGRRPSKTRGPSPEQVPMRRETERVKTRTAAGLATEWTPGAGGGHWLLTTVGWLSSMRQANKAKVEEHLPSKLPFGGLGDSWIRGL